MSSQTCATRKIIMVIPLMLFCGGSRHALKPKAMFLFFGCPAGPYRFVDDENTVLLQMLRLMLSRDLEP